MKTTILPLLFLMIFQLHAQQATEVYVFDMDKSYRLTNPVNISNNPGFYDNQPSFIDNHTLLYASTRNHQTDIKYADLRKGTQQWVTNTAGSEFSPTVSDKSHIYSAIRLDENGTQRLYNYNSNNGGYVELVKDQKIGYYIWYDKNTIVSFLAEDIPKLMVHNLKEGTHYTFKENIGRSLHKIPNSNLISYIDKSETPWKIQSFDPLTGNTSFIANTLEEQEDMAWTPNGDILMGKGEVLYTYDPRGKQKWIPVSSLKYFNLDDISRIAVSPNGKKIALVIDEGIPATVPEANKTIVDIGVVVKNKEKSLAFYKNILGMKEVGQFTIDKDFGKKSGLTSGHTTEVTVLQFDQGPHTVQLKLMSFGKYKNWLPDYIQQDLGVQYITIRTPHYNSILKRIQENKIELLGSTPIELNDGRPFLLIKDYDGTFIEVIGNGQ